YFTRSIEASIIENKSGKQIVCHLKKWFENGFIPFEVITDNEKEFLDENFKDMCVKFGIIHNKIGVEAHRSNGRVKRVLSSIREAN
ncbi:hypothetical protein COBT_004158, partial [Conglomerata obtusa]